MFYNAKNKTLSINNTYMDYIVFGRGEKNLIIIPGLSMKSIKGAAVPLACMYRIFAKEYKVYIFDKVYHLKETYSIQDMANDVVYAMKKLGIKNSDVLGISQGGMIAQFLAINNPQIVNKLILGVTLSRPNPTVKTVIERWIKYTTKNDYTEINREIFTLMYSETYQKKYKLIMPILIQLGKPNDLKKFAISAKACISFDVYNELDHIKCPVLVLGAAKDKIVTGEASEEIAQKLKCKIHIYPNLGHAAYDEANDFNQKIYDFLQDNV